MFISSLFFNSLTTCPSSGKINLFIANLTAPDDPGVQKTALLPITPAMARDRIAAEPISS